MLGGVPYHLFKEVGLVHGAGETVCCVMGKNISGRATIQDKRSFISLPIKNPGVFIFSSIAFLISPKITVCKNHHQHRFPTPSKKKPKTRISKNKLTVGTIFPSFINSSASFPISDPFSISARRRSPEDKCVRWNSSSNLRHCVPFPFLGGGEGMRFHRCFGT